MMNNQFVETNKQGIDIVRVGDVEQIKSPFFPPEIKGPEGLQALLRSRSALDNHNPIMVPGYRWKDIRSKPMFKQVRKEIQQLITDHPILYYEPVELLRYTRPKNLVTYAFQGNRSSSREFYSSLRDGNYDEAVDKLPTFFQPFLERQLDTLYDNTDNAESPANIPYTQGTVYEAWRDPRADRGFTDYFDAIVEDASRSPGSVVIPPAPPILKSSGQDTVDRSFGVNRYMMQICKTKSSNMAGQEVLPYFHLYIDQGAFEPGSNDTDQIARRLEKELDEVPGWDDGRGYSGLALTISNYERAWQKNGLSRNIERFVNRVTNVARQNGLPVLLPRSGWYGTHLTDEGVHAFSSLLNGNHKYNQRTNSGMSKEAMYGTVPIYGDAVDVNIKTLEKVLRRNNGNVHSVPGLPDSPPTFNPGATTSKGKFGKPGQFRAYFGKPRRLIHIKEARELRKGIRNGRPKPARRYLERSEHPHLS